MNRQLIDDQALVNFLRWCLPKLGLRWAGFRKVRSTVRKRLTRRIRELGLPDLPAYRRKLEADPSEWSELEIMCHIPISRFYRDRAVFDYIADQVLPACADVARSRSDRTLRVLSSGSASGEEPYTISLIWSVRLTQAWPDIALQILALDIDTIMMRRAAQACYGAGSIKELPPDLATEGFELRDGLYCLRHQFRVSVSLRQTDIRQGVPDGPFELILCRNTAFTYFDPSAQEAVLAQFDAKLDRHGYLVIGAHETLPSAAGHYARTEPGLPIYRRREVTAKPVA